MLLLALVDAKERYSLLNKYPKDLPSLETNAFGYYIYRNLKI